MKKTLIVIFVLTRLISPASAQLLPLSLQQRVQNSEIVVEGKVLSKNSFWDSARRHIYTANLISVYKVFKGEVSGSTIELITIGGTVGNEREDVSYGLTLQEGDVGVFTCIPDKTPLTGKANIQRLKAYAEVQGFIKYDVQNGTARDVFNVYPDISKVIYPQIRQFTKADFKVLRKADYKISQ